MLDWGLLLGWLPWVVIGGWCGWISHRLRRLERQFHWLRELTDPRLTVWDLQAEETRIRLESLERRLQVVETGRFHLRTGPPSPSSSPSSTTGTT